MPDPQPRHVKSSVHQGVLVLTITETQLHGDRLVDSLRRELAASVAAPEAQRVVLNLQNVRSISSAAFRPLLSLRQKMEERGGRLVLCHLAPVVAEAFRATRLLSTSRMSSASSFEVQPDVDRALAVLNPSAADAE
jgi:anti-anti-sigma factor